MSSGKSQEPMFIDDNGRPTFNQCLLQYIKDHSDIALKAFFPKINDQSGIRSKVDGFGKTLLHYAVEYKNDTATKILINYSGCDIHASDNFGQTPLLIALETKNMEILHIFACKVSEVYIDEESGKNWLRLVLDDSKWKQSTSSVLFPKMKIKSGDDTELANILITENCDLRSAIYFGNSVVTNIMIDRGASIDAKDVKGNTALHYAIRLGDTANVKLLLERGANVNIENEKGETALILATNLKNSEHLKMLLKRKAYLNAQNIRGNTALHLAVYLETVEIVKLLLEHNAKVNIQNTHGETPLHFAVFCRYVDCVKLLLEHGTDVNIRDGNGDTALHQAVYLGQLEIVKLLLEHSANVNVQNALGRIPLNHQNHFYSTTEQQQILKLLIDHGSNLTMAYQDTNWQMCHILQSDSKEAIEILLNSNGIFFARDPIQRTIVHHLTKNLKNGVYELLYTREFDANVRDLNDHTPLHVAAKYGNEMACEVLLDKGADVDAIAVGSSWGTPLLYACYFMKSIEHKRCVDLLLERGANAQFTVDGRYTTINLAWERNSLEVAIKILSHISLGESLGTAITELIRRQIRDNVHFEYDYKLLKNQIRKMKAEPIHGEVTLFKLLTEHERKVAGYMRNEELLVKIQSRQSNRYHSNEYFNEQLDKRITNAIQLAKLIEQAETALYRLLDSMIKFNFYIVCEIVRYLDRQDLVNIINM